MARDDYLPRPFIQLDPFIAIRKVVRDIGGPLHFVQNWASRDDFLIGQSLDNLRRPNNGHAIRHQGRAFAGELDGRFAIFLRLANLGGEFLIVLHGVAHIRAEVLRNLVCNVFRQSEADHATVGGNLELGQCPIELAGIDDCGCGGGVLNCAVHNYLLSNNLGIWAVVIDWVSNARKV